MKAGLWMALAGLVLAAAGGCGVRNDGAPRALADKAIPYGLLEEAPATTVRPARPSVPTATVNVYFVSGAHVIPVRREVNAPGSVPKALTALLFGPTEDESARGIRSAINPAAATQARAIDSATYLVDLSVEFAQGSTSEQALSVAQIVFTATDLPGVSGVRFSLNGVPIQVPTPSGASGDPVGRDAFADLAPQPAGVNPPA